MGTFLCQSQILWGVTGRAELASQQGAPESPFSLLSYEAMLLWGNISEESYE